MEPSEQGDDFWPNCSRHGCDCENTAAPCNAIQLRLCSPFPMISSSSEVVSTHHLLPLGWEWQQTSKGRVFYVNQAKHETTRDFKLAYFLVMMPVESRR